MAYQKAYQLTLDVYKYDKEIPERRAIRNRFADEAQCCFDSLQYCRGIL